MANFNTYNPTRIGAAFGMRPTAAIRSVLNFISDWSNRRATHKALSKLTDYQLSDIGLTRADIENIAR